MPMPQAKNLGGLRTRVGFGAMIVDRDAHLRNNILTLRFLHTPNSQGRRTRNTWLTSCLGASSATSKASTTASGKFVCDSVPLSDSHGTHSLFSRFSGPQQPHICCTMNGQVLHTCIGIVALMPMMKTKVIDWSRRLPTIRYFGQNQIKYTECMRSASG